MYFLHIISISSSKVHLLKKFFVNITSEICLLTIINVYKVDLAITFF